VAHNVGMTRTSLAMSTPTARAAQIRRRRLFFVLLICTTAVLATACDAQISLGGGESGSGDFVMQSYDLTGFDELEISGSFDAVVEIGDTYSIEVLVDDNLLDYVDVRVRGDELKVGLESGVSTRNGTFEVNISMPEMVALSVSGASDVVVDGIDEDELELDISGSTDVLIEGESKNVVLDASGSSDVDIRLAGVDEVIVDLSGASSAAFSSANTVNGELSGASDLWVPSSAVVSVETSGASDVTKG